MIELVRQHRQTILALAAQRGADNVRIFGSAVRGDFTQNSDIDFLVRFDADTSLFDRGGLWTELHELLGVNIDLVDEISLREEIRKEILGEAIPI